MYSHLLKYILAFCFIAYCNGTPSATVGCYEELVFSQRAPGAIFDYLRQTIQIGTNTTEVFTYVQEYWDIINADGWIVEELRPIEYLRGNSVTMSNCVNEKGETALYESEVPTEDFRQELRLYWPALFTGENENDLWKKQYNLHGSCIDSNPTNYFTLAKTLLRNHNIGIILRQENIKPGGIYDLYFIMNSIRRRLKVLPYIKCLQTQNSAEQYLLEVQICLDRARRLIDCHCFVIDHCKPGIPVKYLDEPSE